MRAHVRNFDPPFNWLDDPPQEVRAFLHILQHISPTLAVILLLLVTTLLQICHHPKVDLVRLSVARLVLLHVCRFFGTTAFLFLCEPPELLTELTPTPRISSEAPLIIFAFAPLSPIACSASRACTRWLPATHVVSVLVLMSSLAHLFHFDALLRFKHHELLASSIITRILNKRQDAGHIIFWTKQENAVVPT